MTVKIRSAIVPTALTAIVLVVAMKMTRAQEAPSRVPFFAEVTNFTGPEEAGWALPFSQNVPSGKRLIIQHVSVRFLTSSFIPQQPIQAYCQVSGNGRTVSGRAQPVYAFVPLLRFNDTNTYAFTGAGPLTLYLEPGPIGIMCTSGLNGFNLRSLQASIVGELVPR
jgi:hypothetical protein